MNTAKLRYDAIEAIASAEYDLQRVNFKEKHIKDMYGENVFSEAVQRERLPKPVFKALQKTIKQGAQLTDPAVADAVASAMKDWAIEHGATHFTHLFQPMTGLTAEKHDSFLAPVGDERGVAVLDDEEVADADRGYEVARVAHDDAVLGAEAAVSGEDGVAVGVLRVHAFQGQPTAHVVPAIGRLHGQHFLGVLHDRVVDADSV